VGIELPIVFHIEVIEVYNWARIKTTAKGNFEMNLRKQVSC
jgi:hypothetical protein